MDDFERAFQRIRRILKDKKWPGVEESTSYGTPSLKVKGKMLVRLREPGVLVIMCNVEAKEMLLQVAPHIYFELPHYRGYPAILARMDQIEDDEIAEMIEIYYRKAAPKKLLSELEEVESQPRAEENPQVKKSKTSTKPKTATTTKRAAGPKPVKKSRAGKR